MFLPHQVRRAFGAALVVVSCLGTACQTTRPPAAAEGPPPSLDAPPVANELDAAALRHADALANYATGVAVQFRQGLDEAITWYRRAAELDPGNSSQASQLGSLLLSRKQYDEAIALLERAVEANPNDASLWFWLGVGYRAKERLPDALQAEQRALKTDPTFLNAVQASLEIYVSQKDYAAAAKLLEQAARAKSSDSGYWLRLGDLTVAATKERGEIAKLVDAQQAVRCYERATELAPDNTDILGRLANQYEAQGQPEKATALFSRLSQARPEDLALRSKLALTYLAADQKEKAVAEFEAIVKRDPLKFEIYNYLGELYEDLDKPEKAIGNFQQSLSANPNQLQPYLRIALLQLKLKEYDNALKTLGEAHDRYPTAYQVAYFTGLAYSDQKKPAEAVTAFADAETLATESTEPVKLDSNFYFYFGSACERSGDYTRAAQMFRKAIDLDPDNHLALNYLGYMWADRGLRLEESLSLIKKALEKSPDNGAYLDSLGWVLFKMGKPEEALPQLRHAVELVKDDAVVLEHLADVLYALGQKDEALANLKKAREQDPDNKSLTEKLEKWQAGEAKQ